MKAMLKSMLLVVTIFVAAIQHSAAGDKPDKDKPDHPPKAGVLFGTTGACNNASPGGPCGTATSTLVQLDPGTGALIKTIGPVGFVVNGLAWDSTSGKLYATTPVGDQHFHGLITIDPRTGAGTPVNKNVHNFGLAVDLASPLWVARPLHCHRSLRPDGRLV